MIYLAAQYLAAAGKSFVKYRDDDSHTNLGLWEAEKSLVTRELSDQGALLSLNIPEFSLNWILREQKETKSLHNATHIEILGWLQHISQSLIGKAYSFDLHYDLGYALKDDFRFSLEDRDALESLFQLRVFANSAIASFLKRNSLDSEIRIWPHHFDSGAFVPNANGGDVSIGLGMAVPDSLIDDHYFYLSGYKDQESVDTSNFNSLSVGSWLYEGFKGAVLPVSGMSEQNIAVFLDEALNQYIG